MIHRTEKTELEYGAAQQRSLEKHAPTIAIFTLPKPFTDPETNLNQRNAIASWKALGPEVETILLGGEPGISETAIEFDTKFSSEVGQNQQGTPLLSDAFRIAHELSDAEILIYCNCDVLLFQDLVKSIELIRADRRFDEFVAFGRRTDLKVDFEIDQRDHQTMQSLFQSAKSIGTPAPRVCKEFFAFTRSLYRRIPEFAVGRGNWDNWMIAHAKSQKVPVVDVSEMVTIIHQEHDYRHLKKSRLNCYVSGDEARRNQKLAGGKHVISGSTGTWTLSPEGLKKTPLSWLNIPFWTDFPRFAQMVARLPFQR